MPKVKKEVQMGDVKKATAAISAVLLYIKAEAEAIAMQSALQAPAAGPVMPLVSRPPVPVMKSWALNGRQAQMQMRNLMQLRMFCKL
ncbi:MAG: hypothetical protein PVI82_02065 [Desulfobacterales bacterium]|jgi:hypothetical protein